MITEHCYDLYISILCIFSLEIKDLSEDKTLKCDYIAMNLSVYLAYLDLWMVNKCEPFMKEK